MFGKDFTDVCGNKKLIGHIRSEILAGSIGHAYIIEGPHGVGKRAFANAMAAALLCEDKSGALPCGVCSSCRRIAAGSHPDIKVVGRGDRASVGVDVIRGVRSDAHIIPSEAERKIYIIEDADTMTAQAQNAFLLSLEEPPSYVTYLLLCDDTSTLLETILSRAPSLRMCPASNGELEEFILNKNKDAARIKRSDPEAWAELLVCAGGNAGTALRLLTGKALSERIAEKRDALSLLESLLSNDGDVYLSLGALKKTKRDAVLLLLGDISSALRDMLLTKKSRTADTVFFTDADAAVNAAALYSSKKLALALDAVNGAVDRVAANAQTSSALLSMAVMIKNIK